MWKNTVAKCQFETPHPWAQTMKPAPSALKQMWSPQCHTWRRHTKGGNYNSTILIIHTHSWNHRLSIQSKRILTEIDTKIIQVEFSQVDKHKPWLFGFWLLVWLLRTPPACLLCPQFSGREGVSSSDSLWAPCWGIQLEGFMFPSRRRG